MSKGSKAGSNGDTSVAANEDPRSLSVFKPGIKTSRDFAAGMSALMSDLVESRITPSVGNAVCNAAGKLLKIVEMQHKYGKRESRGGNKVLSLIDENPPISV